MRAHLAVALLGAALPLAGCTGAPSAALEPRLAWDGAPEVAAVDFEVPPGAREVRVEVLSWGGTGAPGMALRDPTAELRGVLELAGPMGWPFGAHLAVGGAPPGTWTLRLTGAAWGTLALRIAAG